MCREDIAQMNMDYIFYSSPIQSVADSTRDVDERIYKVMNPSEAVSYTHLDVYKRQAFFSETGDEKLVFGEDDIFVKEDAEGIRGRIRWLVPSAQKNQMEPIMVELGPGGETEEDDPHEGEEFGYVLSGTLKIVLGDRVERVKRDESFYFRPTAPHKLVNAGKAPCRVLWVSTPPSF